VPSRRGVLRSGAGLARKDLLLLLQEGLEVVLRDAIHESFDPVAVLDPLAGGVVESRGDIDADPLVARAGVEMESRMLLARATVAIGLAAGAVLEHERAAEQGLVRQELDGAGAGVALRGRALRTRCHESS
jgi:hypothetical protein